MQQPQDEVKILFYDHDQAARALSVKASLLRKLVQQGLPSCKLGRRRVYPVKALEEWAAKQTD